MIGKMKFSASMIISVLTVGLASAEQSEIEDVYNNNNYLSGNKPTYPTNTISPDEAANPDTNCKNWLKDSICTAWNSTSGNGGRICSAFLRGLCRKTCGLCATTCVDSPWCRGKEKSSRFASEIRCMNTAWIFSCPVSCNRCAPKSSKHHDALGSTPTSAQAAVPATNCKNWNDDAWCQAKAAHCANKKSVQRKCRQTCSLCAAPDCADDAKCAGMRITSGKCYTAKSKVLLRMCPASCGWCDGMNTNFDQTSTDLHGNKIVEVSDPGQQ